MDVPEEEPPSRVTGVSLEPQSKEVQGVVDLDDNPQFTCQPVLCLQPATTETTTSHSSSSSANLFGNLLPVVIPQGDHQDLVAPPKISDIESAQNESESPGADEPKDVQLHNSTPTRDTNPATSHQADARLAPKQDDNANSPNPIPQPDDAHHHNPSLQRASKETALTSVACSTGDHEAVSPIHAPDPASMTSLETDPAQTHKDESTRRDCAIASDSDFDDCPQAVRCRLRNRMRNGPLVQLDLSPVPPPGPGAMGSRQGRAMAMLSSNPELTCRNYFPYPPPDILDAIIELDRELDSWRSVFPGFDQDFIDIHLDRFEEENRLFAETMKGHADRHNALFGSIMDLQKKLRDVAHERHCAQNDRLSGRRKWTQQDRVNILTRLAQEEQVLNEARENAVHELKRSILAGNKMLEKALCWDFGVPRAIEARRARERQVQMAEEESAKLGIATAMIGLRGSVKDQDYTTHNGIVKNTGFVANSRMQALDSPPDPADMKLDPSLLRENLDSLVTAIPDWFYILDSKKSLPLKGNTYWERYKSLLEVFTASYTTARKEAVEAEQRAAERLRADQRAAERRATKDQTAGQQQNQKHGDGLANTRQDLFEGQPTSQDDPDSSAARHNEMSPSDEWEDVPEQASRNPKAAPAGRTTSSRVIGTQAAAQSQTAAAPHAGPTIAGTTVHNKISNEIEKAQAEACKLHRMIVGRQMEHDDEMKKRAREERELRRSAKGYNIYGLLCDAGVNNLNHRPTIGHSVLSDTNYPHNSPHTSPHPGSSSLVPEGVVSRSAAAGISAQASLSQLLERYGGPAQAHGSLGRQGNSGFSFRQTGPPQQPHYGRPFRNSELLTGRWIGNPPPFAEARPSQPSRYQIHELPTGRWVDDRTPSHEATLSQPRHRPPQGQDPLSNGEVDNLATSTQPGPPALQRQTTSLADDVIHGRPADNEAGTSQAEPVELRSSLARPGHSRKGKSVSWLN
ncbi:hypothetical protein VTI74DRAFT_7090 [Chaetomium olivicolor]